MAEENRPRLRGRTRRGLAGDTPKRPAKPRFLVIGRITKPHGVHGEVRAIIITDMPERFEWLERVHVSADEWEPQPPALAVESVRYHGDGVLLKLATIDDRDAADELRNHWLQVPVEDAIPLAEGEYFLFQLIGLTVVTDTDEPLGEVADLLETGAHNIFVVNGPRGEILLPDIPDVVKTIDFDAGRVVVHLLPGLLP